MPLKKKPGQIQSGVDTASTKLAKERIYGVRRGDAFYKTADAIQAKHGSRKSGLPMTGRKRTRKSKPAGQLEFDV